MLALNFKPFVFPYNLNVNVCEDIFLQKKFRKEKKHENLRLSPNIVVYNRKYIITICEFIFDFSKRIFA